MAQVERGESYLNRRQLACDGKRELHGKSARRGKEETALGTRVRRVQQFAQLIEMRRLRFEHVVVVRVGG